jgi:hypothetical protein
MLGESVRSPGFADNMTPSSSGQPAPRAPFVTVAPAGRPSAGALRRVLGLLSGAGDDHPVIWVIDDQALVSRIIAPGHQSVRGVMPTR